jgi:transcriptional regulator NrdR family protein
LPDPVDADAKVAGRYCPACHGVRLHVIKAVVEPGSIRRFLVCTTCNQPTPLDRPNRPGISCPKCGDYRMKCVHVRQRPGRTVRIRKCRRCNHRIRTRETVESLAC